MVFVKRSAESVGQLQFLDRSVAWQEMSTGALTETDPFLDADFLLLPSCKL